jgi:hypothetical protein
MGNILILTIWCMLGLICGFGGIFIYYRKYRESLRLMSSKVEDVCQELYYDVKRIGRHELENTIYGRELLANLERNPEYLRFHRNGGETYNNSVTSPIIKPEPANEPKTHAPTMQYWKNKQFTPSDSEIAYFYKYRTIIRPHEPPNAVVG